jgi:hypothetical protein
VSSERTCPFLSAVCPGSEADRTIDCSEFASGQHFPGENALFERLAFAVMARAISVAKANADTGRRAMNQDSTAPIDFGFPPAPCRVHAFSPSVGCELPGVRAERSMWSRDQHESLDKQEVRPKASSGRADITERVR